MTSELIRATNENIDRLFKGILIEVSEPFGSDHKVPGWECRQCGWRIGSQRLPPAHICPDAGVEQRSWD